MRLTGLTTGNVGAGQVRQSAVVSKGVEAIYIAEVEESAKGRSYRRNPGSVEAEGGSGQLFPTRLVLEGET